MSRTTRAKEDKARRLDDALRALEEGVAGISSGEDFRRYLAFQARFHAYSANNVVLIMLQRPDATRVAGYRRWQQMGRQVRRGEKGITILAPVIRKEKDAKTGEERRFMAGCKPTTVFAYEQTDGEPLPERPPARLLRGSGAASSGLLARLHAAATGRFGVPVARDADGLPHGARGGYFPGPPPRIALLPTLAPDAEAKTLAHELAHHLAVQNPVAQDGRPAPKSAREAHAEGTAFVVLRHFGIDAGGHTFGYIVGWTAGEKALLGGVMGAVARDAKGIIAAVVEEEEGRDEEPRAA